MECKTCLTRFTVNPKTVTAALNRSAATVAANLSEPERRYLATIGVLLDPDTKDPTTHALRYYAVKLKDELTKLAGLGRTA